MQNLGTSRGAAIKASEEWTVDSTMLSADNVKWAKLTKDFPTIRNATESLNRAMRSKFELIGSPNEVDPRPAELRSKALKGQHINSYCYGSNYKDNEESQGNKDSNIVKSRRNVEQKQNSFRQDRGCNGKERVKQGLKNKRSHRSALKQEQGSVSHTIEEQSRPGYQNKVADC